MITNMIPGDLRTLSKVYQNLDVKEFYWGLVCFSREPYAAIVDHDFEDEINYGVFARSGGCLSELAMTWVKHSDKETFVHLSVHSDGFLLLDTPMHKKIINRLKKFKGKEFTPDDFTRLLLSLGFEDVPHTPLPVKN